MKLGAAALTVSLFGVGVTPAAALDPSASIAHYLRASWTEKDGLPSSRISAITQDHDGYLWLATDAGLFRFDGVRFFSWEALGRSPLPNIMVRALLTSRSGDLWIGFGGTGGVMRWHEGKPIYYAANDGLPKTAQDLFEDHDGIIWVGGLGGLSRFQNGRWERMEGREGLPAEMAVSIYEDREGNLWVSTEGAGLFCRAAGTTTFRPFPVSKRIRAFAEDAAGALWYAGPELGIGRLEASNVDRTPERLETLNGDCLLRDRDGNLWAGTVGQGLWRISNARGRTPKAEPLAGEPGLTNDVVRSLFEDREGNLWVGTQSGLNRVSDASLITMLSDEEVSQAAPTVTATTEDGSIWVGTENGLYRFAGDLRWRYDRSDGLPTATVTALHRDARGTLWVATDPGGLARFTGGKFVPVSLPPHVHLPLLWVIAADSDGSIWLGELTRGLFRTQEGTVTSFENVPGLGGKTVLSAIVDRTGRLWIGFVGGGVVAYENGRFRSYAKADGLAGGDVGAVFEDHAGTIWVGSEDGLSRFENGRFVSATAKNGLPGHVRAIVEDGQGLLWFGVNAGIVRVNPSELNNVADDASYRVRYDLYDISDGLRGTPMSRRGYPTAARGGDGTLWFVTSNGVAVAYPTRVKRDPVPPPVRVERVLANGHYLDPAPGLQLPPLTANLEIDYTALSFTAPAKVQFRYMLQGFDKDWVDAGVRREAFYTNLPPGDYQFLVKANNNGVWNEAGAQWAFSIRPTFFQTNWFYAACFAAFSLLVLGAWQVRARQVRREFALVLAERARVAREIHDTLLQSLAGISLQFHDVSSEIDGSPQTAKTHLERLRRYVEMNMREARQSIWDLRSPMLQTRDLAAALREHGESITAGTSVRFDLTVSGTPRARLRRVEEALLRIGQEAVINAVRHARATRVQLDLRYDDEAVTLRAFDDGCGFESNAPETSAVQHWGLAIMRERAKQIGGHFRVLSTPGKGTEVEIVVSLASEKVREAS